MADVHDVARYILQKREPMSTWKLQKLVYYSQAWHLVWDDDPLFPEGIQAWANGPVVRELYDVHRGRFKVSNWPQGKVGNLTDSEKGTIDAVLDFYGDKSGHWLSELTHSEPPWQEARRGLDPKQRSNKRVRREDMAEYYGSLVTS